MSVLYLCGPINGCTDAECKDWRQAVKDALPGWDFSDPMDRDFRGIEGDHTREIVEGDKEDIAECDAVLVVTDRPSWGTAMEILFAWEIGKPVVVVHPPGAISPWLRYHARAVLPTVDQAIVYFELMGLADAA